MSRPAEPTTEPATAPTAEALIRALNLRRHPEGGWYAEDFRSAAAPGERAAMTSIYFLLRAGERSHWHRLHTADEIWYHHAGAPLELMMSSGDDSSADGIHRRVLGSDIVAGQRPQLVVPAGRWQTARSLGEWTLFGCATVPGFEFTDFELAPPDWSPM